MSLMLKMLFEAIGQKTYTNFIDKCKDSVNTQSQLLNQIITKNHDALYGKRYGFKTIKNYNDFKKRIPLVTYDDIQSYVEAALKGEKSQLTSQSPVFFATTSGTTGKQKYIPVTPDSKAMKSQLLRAWFSKFYIDHPNIFNGRILAVVSPEAEFYSPAGIPCGAESGHGYRSMPKITASSYSSPYEIFTIKDYEAKYYLILRIALCQDITLIYSVNPSNILLLIQRLAEYTPDFIKDIAAGSIPKKFQINQELSMGLKYLLRPNPKRARELEKAASAANGVLIPKDIWPNLSAIASWKGGSVGVYIDKIMKYFSPNTIIRDCGYYASEHRGSVPIYDNDSSGLLAVSTNFYEFYPATEQPAPKKSDLLRAHELEKGKQYYIFVTTVSGLYRYDMNDIIEVTDFFHQTPLIRFVQKGKGVSSFTGEKLYENQVILAVENAFKGYPGDYEFIAAIGYIQGDIPGYLFLTEFENSPEESLGKALAVRIEKFLCDLNIEYQAKRRSQRLQPLTLRAVTKGSFYNYRKRAIENGRTDSQFKILKLTNDTDFANEFPVENDFSAD